MASCFDHKFLWVLDSADCGGVDRVIAAAQDTGHGLCVKFHDGDPADDAKYGFQEKFAKIAERCASLNIPLLAWGYCYGDAYGNLLKEADAAVDVLTRYPVGYVIDAEVYWEVPQGRDWAKRFGELVLAKVPDAKERLAYCPYWNLRWHQMYPAREFSTFCSVVMPQDYFDLAQRATRASREEMLQITAEDYGPLGLHVYPIGEFSAGLDGVKDFLEIVEGAGFAAWSFWLFDRYQDSVQLRYLAELAKVANSGLAAEVAGLRRDVETLKLSVGYLLEITAKVKEAIS
jgi:hypothetical protein